ncbi:MAG: hypothetical protein K9N46_11590 [Candidatus Marinimicrobia bacterium]|nr:hypothetical protein [Candidatus Neomarinimicrobiota bacterium]MCF7827396.1 hypothetical protein [Candidatus Neomarinimicrobiota bacterium]MCF7881371.1 hypothetical protein [Candidatus Neomarinimicrobiota bacterium]
MKNLSIFLTVFILAAAVNAAQIEPITVDVWNGNATIQTEQVSVEFSSTPPALTISRDDQVRLQTKKHNAFVYETDGEAIPFTKTGQIHRRFQGFVADLATESGETGQLVVKMDAESHITLELLPPAGAAEAVQVNLEQSAEDHFYGLGDLWSTETVDAAGHKVEMWDHTGTPDECAYVPFYMSTAGYGLFADNAYLGTFDFGKTDKNVTAIRFESPNLSMHLWVGETMRDILPQYLDLTGYPPQPPQWTFLPQIWHDAGTWDNVFTDVDRMKENDMPLGAVWLDRPWAQGEYGSDDFIFDKERYPEPEKQIKRLHDQDIRLIVWGCDFLTPDSRYFEEGKENNYFAAVNKHESNRSLDQYIVDFAQPEAQKWFKDIIKNALEMGVDGIKLDRGQTYPKDATPPSGRDPMEMHNYHAYLIVKTYAEALEEVHGDDYQLTPRAGWAGTQAWTMKWPGDLSSGFDTYSGLPSAVRAQTAAGMTGFAFWGTDVPGYGNNATKKAFLRWMEFGTFSPLLQLVGKGNHNDIPFSWDEEAVQVYKYYAQLREKMLPYLTDQAKVSAEMGIPMVRHLAWEWPEDENVHDLHYQYLFGDDLLVAPVIDKKTSRTVYLPEGQWVDFWNRDRVLDGPQSLEEDVPVNKIPVYIRSGSKYAFELPEMSLPE